jgi:hypothetical protein
MSKRLTGTETGGIFAIAGGDSFVILSYTFSTKKGEEAGSGHQKISIR